MAVLLFFHISWANDIQMDSFEDEFKSPSFIDPLSGYNRAMTNFNDMIYKNIFIPTFKGYDFIIPNEAQMAISTFLIIYFIRLDLKIIFCNLNLKMPVKRLLGL